MTITVDELQNKLDYYLKLSNQEHIYITKDNKVISVLIGPKAMAMIEFLDFPNKLPEIDPDFDYNKAIEEEILKRCGFK